MKRWLKHFAVLGIAALPAAVGAQTTLPKIESTVAAAQAGKTDVLPATTERVVDGGGGGCTNCRQKFMVFGEYLFWGVHGVDVPYAQPFDGVNPLLSVPRGQVGVVSPEFSSGFRIGGGLSNQDGGAIVATFTYFRTDNSNQIDAPGGFVLRNFLAFPNTANAAADSLSARAEYRIELATVDIDYRCCFHSSDSVILSWVAGARYGHIDSRLDATYLITGTTTVSSNIDFDGIGPRVGLDGQYRVAGGFYGYCQGFVDLLFGQFRAEAVQQNVFGGLIGQSSINSNRMVPVLEFELGAGWQSESGRVRLSAGYYVGSWFNTVTQTSFAGAISNANYTTNGNNFRDTTTFDGLVARFEFRY